jgi:hypothetical protein
MRVAVRAFALIAISGSATAQTTEPNWQAALNSGSQRLMLFALQSEKPVGADDFVSQLQYDLAMRQAAGAGITMLSYDASLRPIVEYDNNINGGLPKSYFYIGSTRFDFSDDDTAKAGVVFGAKVDLSTRLALAPGRTLDLTASASQAHSIDHGLDKLRAETSACVAQFLGNTSWADFCFGNSFSQDAKSVSKDSYLSFGGSKVFASGYGIHEVSVTFKENWNTDFDRKSKSHDSYSKASVALKLLTAKADLGALAVDLDLGEFVPNQNTRLFGTGVSLTRPIAGKVTTLFASYGLEGGASFLGKDRLDEVYSIGINRNVTKHANITLRLSQRSSNASLFDGVKTVDFDVNLIGF